MFTDLTLREFLDALASKEPVPGGGSGAALAGALCAALDDVVLNTPWGAQGGWAARSLVSTFHEQVQEAYKTLAKFYPHRIVVLNGVDKPENIHHRVMQVVTPLLS